MQHFCEMKDLGKNCLENEKWQNDQYERCVPKRSRGPVQKKGEPIEARSTSKAVGHERSLDATKAVRHELGGQQKNCKVLRSRRYGQTQTISLR